MHFLDKRFKAGRGELWTRWNAFHEHPNDPYNGFYETKVNYEPPANEITGYPVPDRLLDIVSKNISEYLGGTYVACRPVWRFWGSMENDDLDCLRFGFEKPEPERKDYVRGDKIIGYAYINVFADAKESSNQYDLVTKIVENEWDLSIKQGKHSVSKSNLRPHEAERGYIGYKFPLRDISFKEVVDENIEYSKKYYRKYPYLRDDMELVAMVDPDTDTPAIVFLGKDLKKNEVIWQKACFLVHDMKSRKLYSNPQCSHLYLVHGFRVGPRGGSVIDVSLEDKFKHAVALAEMMVEKGMGIFELQELLPDVEGSDYGSLSILEFELRKMKSIVSLFGVSGQRPDISFFVK